MDPKFEYFGTVVYGIFYFIGLVFPIIAFWMLRRLLPGRTRGFRVTLTATQSGPS